MFPSSNQDRNSHQVMLPLVVRDEEVLNGFNFLFYSLFPFVMDDLPQFSSWENNLPTLNEFILISDKDTYIWKNIIKSQ